MEMTNKALALLLLTAIVIGLGGTIMVLNKISSGSTGLVTGTGRVNLTINSTTNCVIDTNVSIGAGVQPLTTYSLTTDKDNTVYGFQSCLDAASVSCQGLQINNTGNQNLNVSIRSDSAASSFLGSQTGLGAEDFRYYIINGSAIGNASQGCRNITNGTAAIPGIQFNVGTTDTLVCNNLTYADGTDTMHVEFNITLENDISSGAKAAIITVTCENTAAP
jgi:hypothetical protein